MVSAKNCSVCNFLVSSLDGKDLELCLKWVKWVEGPWLLCAGVFCLLVWMVLKELDSSDLVWELTIELPLQDFGLCCVVAGLLWMGS